MKIENNKKLVSERFHFKTKNSILILIGGSLLVSLGILMITIGGSWDVTNHLLNKPETFFSPSHAMMYTGVAVALIGSVIFFFGWRSFSKPTKNLFIFPLKVTLIGIALLVGAGPLDFVWHSNFGLDGLLSPPHLTLIAGMLLTGLGGLFSLSRYVNQKITTKDSSKYRFLIIIGMIPVWLSATGLFYSFSLPFSDTDYFDFNPDPNFAVIFATISFPFLISFMLLLSSNLANNKFGILSITGILFLVINCMTSIVPNSAIHYTIPYYFLNIIPLIVADVIISTFRKNKIAIYAAGGILGTTFYMLYYPLLTYTYNDVLFHQVVWPSIISNIYFEMMHVAYPLIIGPAIIFGIIGAILAGKIKQKLVQPKKLVEN
ncbi:MAG: conserved membrane protein of unknown function [Nitrosopumilales archaeon]|nr:MAG: conserved membrane protein of unknown function [Nitrosopumilales archaeon]